MFNCRAALTLLITILASGCANLSTYQTAKTLDPGEKTIGVALSQAAINVGTDENTSGFDETVTYVVPEIFFRVGIKKNLDVGVKLYPFAGLIDVKYQFVKKSIFNAAFDLGVSYTKLTDSFGGNSNELKFIDFYPTLLLTYHITPSINATLAPKVIVRHVSEDSVKSEITTIPGATLTLTFGGPTKGFSVMPEIGFYTVDGVNFTNIGIGLSW